MAVQTLSRRALNRVLLARQLLLERSTIPIPQAIERIGGLQTQYAPSGYVGLWSRLVDDGAVAGAWSVRDRRIDLDPYEALAAKDQRAVEREREALETFHA